MNRVCVLCPHCKGETPGRVWSSVDDEMVPCPDCKGRGWLPATEIPWPPDAEKLLETYDD